MLEIDNTIKMYNFDLNMTNQCNMNCDYCFEHNKRPEFMVNSILRRFKECVNKMLESKYFNRKYHVININFWGGEPTLSSDKIKWFVEQYIEERRVRFFIFSNGYDIKPSFMNFLNEIKDFKVVGNHPKMIMQVSYDGYPLHDMHRKDKRGLPTSERVLSTIIKLDSYKIPYTIKSVINPDDFEYMLDAYRDIKKLTYEDGSTFFKSQNYFPSIEYHAPNCENVEEKAKKLRDTLIKIAAEEIVSVKDRKEKPFFSWFYKNKASCSAGENYVAVDINGNVYPCHGCLYVDKKEIHEITNINDSNWLENIIQFSDYMSKQHDIMPESCKKCEVNFCLRCNVVKFENSKKDKYLEKWRDFDNQPTICKYYKEIEKVAKVYRYKMRRESNGM